MKPSLKNRKMHLKQFRAEPAGSEKKDFIYCLQINWQVYPQWCGPKYGYTNKSKPARGCFSESVEHAGILNTRCSVVLHRHNVPTNSYLTQNYDDKVAYHPQWHTTYTCMALLTSLNALQFYTHLFRAYIEMEWYWNLLLEASQNE